MWAYRSGKRPIASRERVPARAGAGAAAAWYWSLSRFRLRILLGPALRARGS